ncbi:cobalt ECF transporter T component CbiQ [Castellaniella sp.]|uniref:cobalt ECF transporter T component CbiQ n=1 Tax=Castellaniella sp. TaxID=1955812 RepID=UPI003C71ABEB
MINAGRGGGTRYRRGRLEQLAAGLLAAMDHARRADRTTARRGLLQALDARIKLLTLTLIMLAALVAHRLLPIYALLGLTVLLAIASRVSVPRTLLRVWLGVCLFTGFIVLPALVLVPGEPLWTLPVGHLTVTRQGVSNALFVMGRALTASSCMSLLVLTTPWPLILKALRSFRVPAVAVMMLGMAYRYLFLLLQSAQELFVARRSRQLAPLDRRQARHSAIMTMAVLFDRSARLSNEVYLAMLARGYRGEDRILTDFRTRPLDWWALLTGIAIVAAAFYWGR